MGWGDDFKQLLHDDTKDFMDCGLWKPVTIKRDSDMVSATLRCSMIQDYEEMLLENYRSFEVKGAVGLYLDNVVLNFMKDDWDEAFTYPPIAKQQYILFEHIFEIRKVFLWGDTFYEIHFSGMET